MSHKMGLQNKKMIIELLRLARPGQWTKNLIIFAALIFSRHLFNPQYSLKTFFAFVLFCAISGGVYILNDIVDLENDRKHPLKSKRPLASGKISKTYAITGFFVLTLFGLVFSFILNTGFGIVASAYFVLQVFYSFVLKKIVILDILTIAFGFILRVVAGVIVIDVEISSWLLICTLFLALFLGISKRRHEIVMLEKNAAGHREVLGEYSEKLLDQMIAVVTSATVIAYALYTMAHETVAKFNTTKLIYTTPFVLYGIFRYLYLIYKKESGGAPDKVLLTDLPLIINIILWIAAASIIIYA